jgi:hypothetical protein
MAILDDNPPPPASPAPPIPDWLARLRAQDEAREQSRPATADPGDARDLAEIRRRSAERRALAAKHEAESEARREAFRVANGLGRKVDLAGRNLTRMLHATGERPERIAELRRMLRDLGLDTGRWLNWSYPFDHLELWTRPGAPRNVPTILVSHPYGIPDGFPEALRRLGLAFPSIRTHVDDQPSYYGYGTAHFRIEVIDPRPPWRPVPSSSQTRRIAREFRREMSAG